MKKIDLNKLKLKNKDEKNKDIVASSFGKGRKTLGAMSATGIVLVLVVAILANVFISKQNWSYDVTDNKIFSISQQSKKIAKGVKKDVTIYFLNSKKNMDSSYLQIAKQYEKNSKHIKIKYRDIELYPNFASQYLSKNEEAQSGDALVVCGKKARLIPSEDFTLTDMDASGNYTTSVNLEPSITAAINYVTSKTTPVIYKLTGHGEQEFDSSFQTEIQNDNFSFKELNLLTKSSVPKNASILLINAPNTDISSKDLKKLKTYMNKGGKLFYICNTEGGSLKNFESLLGKYGVEINKGIVVEGDNSQYMQNYPTYLLPTIESTDITQPLLTNSSYILAPVSKGLTLSGDATSLLSTTTKSYSKVNLKSKKVEMEMGDIGGPFSICAEVPDAKGNAQLIVLACPSLALHEIDQYVSGANSNFVSNCVNALAKQDDKISIKAKSVVNERATYTTAATQLVSFGAVVVIPVMILLIGTAVVLVRRKSK